MPALPVPIWRAAGIARRLLHRIAGSNRADAAQMDQLVARISNKSGPVRVGIVVCSPAKWSMQTLFDALQADPDFTPVFYPTLSDAGLRLPRAARAAEYRKTRAFFAAIGDIAADLYDPHSGLMAPLSTIAADLVFIQQPWGMQDMPRQLEGRALTAYVHYGYPVISNDAMQFALPGFHPFLWCHFVADEIQANAMRSSGKPQATHMPVTGHPKLDAYLTPAPARGAVIVWPHAAKSDRKRVIFAPHHTLGAGTLNLATFQWSGPALLALVQTHPEVDFILKPHPNLGYEMGRAGAQMQAVYDTVMQGWDVAPNADVVQGGSYFDLFRSSDAMITDSGSFLAEYLPSGQPLIRLVKEGSASLNASGQALADAFYCADDPEALNNVFERVIVQGQDPLAPLRQAATARLMPDARASAERVMDHLRGLLGRA